MDDLQYGPIYSFADWPNRDVPSSPGVYSIWRGAEFIYVGMAGRGIQIAEVDEDGQPAKKSRGLFGRLNAHASGRRSGDQFNVYVCDRLVIPELTRTELDLLRSNELRLDERTKRYIREHLTYRFICTQTGAQAAAIEDDVKSGALSAGRPFLNPAREPNE